MKLILILGKSGSGKSGIAAQLKKILKGTDLVTIEELADFNHLLIFQNRAFIIAQSTTLKVQDIPAKLMEHTAVIDLDFIQKTFEAENKIFFTIK